MKMPPKDWKQINYFLNKGRLLVVGLDSSVLKLASKSLLLNIQELWELVVKLLVALKRPGWVYIQQANWHRLQTALLPP